MLPEARRDRLLIQEVGEELVVYDRERHRIHRLNRTAALVWHHCDGRTSVSDLAALLARELNLPADEGLVWLILDWLEKRIAPWSPDDYRHNTGTGEDNAAAHLRSLTVGHEVIVPVTKGQLDFGPWQRVFYGEWDGQRSKRVLLKAMGI